MGTAEIVGTPERVVVMDTGELDIVLALGITPVGAVAYGEASFIGTILDDAGFARPEPQRVQETFVEVSAEQIGQADGDLLFHGSFGPEGADDRAAVTGGPMWPTIPAVADDRAHEISDDLWYLGIGPIAAGLVLDEIAEYAP